MLRFLLDKSFGSMRLASAVGTDGGGIPFDLCEERSGHPGGGGGRKTGRAPRGAAGSHSAMRSVVFTGRR